MSMYPEARYSPCGVLSFMPDSLGKLIKLNKVPVVAVVHHGNHLHSPFWNFRKKRKVPLHTTMTQILTADQVKSMSVDEINEAVKQGLYYDDYKYAYDNGIAGETMTVETDAGLVYGWHLSENRYRIRLNNPGLVDLQRLPDAAYVELGNPGVPHSVVELPALTWDMAEEIRERAKAKIWRVPPLPVQGNGGTRVLSGRYALAQQALEGDQPVAVV